MTAFCAYNFVRSLSGDKVAKSMKMTAYHIIQNAGKL